MTTKLVGRYVEKGYKISAKLSQVLCEEEFGEKILEIEENRGLIYRNAFEDEFMGF